MNVAAKEHAGGAETAGRACDGSVRIAALLVVGLYGLGLALPRSAWVATTFGIEAWRGFGVVPFAVAGALVLLLAFVPGLAGALSALLGRIANRLPRGLGLALLLAASGTGFWFLTNYRISGDAMSIVLMAADGAISPSNALTSYLHVGLARLPVLDAREAVRLLSCLSGLVYVPAAVGIARLAFPDRARRAGLATLLLTCGAGVLFFGTLEVYAPLAAGVAVYLWAGLRHLRAGGSLALPALALGITFVLHGSAGLLLPSLAILANGGRILPLRWKRLVSAAGAFLLPLLLTFLALYFLTWAGEPPERAALRTGNFVGAMGQGPVLPLEKTTENLPWRYAFLDLDHLLGVLNVLLMAAPAGFVLLLLCRRPKGDPAFRWVAWAAAFFVAFPIFWNVSYSLSRDWDLFVTLGIPVTLAAGLSFFRHERRPGRILAVAAASLFTFVPFVLANHRESRSAYAEHVAVAFRMAPKGDAERQRALKRWIARTKGIPDAEREAHELADRDLEAGFPDSAARILLKALVGDPENSRLRIHLGLVLHAAGRTEEAEETLAAVVREDPTRLGAWIVLADLASRAGDPERAVRLLERGIRVRSRDRLAPEAYRKLADALQAIGETERARAAARLAAPRDR